MTGRPEELVVREALAARHGSKGSEKVFEAFPEFLDVNQFDGFADLPENLDDCRVWFSDKRFDSWASALMRSGRVNCYSIAPQAGASSAQPVSELCLQGGVLPWHPFCSPRSSRTGSPPRPR